MAWRANESFNPDAKAPAPRQWRHYYDLFKLLQTKHQAEATADLKLLARVAEHKSIYFRAGWAKYEEAKPGTLKLMPGARLESIMKRDYEQMQEMIFGDAPDWRDILAAIQKFEATFNTP
ncbi:MAG: nucleotidyl transferase AbiEii/AbiGii toxin family protein [Bdellovibrionaceae bacterium]|nr:nucleotidyl transferase AbiEii/AbiGii toxin family protein [Pseudobdellovibrionaceae bacterium]